MSGAFLQQTTDLKVQMVCNLCPYKRFSLWSSHFKVCNAGLYWERCLAYLKHIVEQVSFWEACFFFFCLIHLNLHRRTNQTKRILCHRLCVDQMCFCWCCREIFPGGFELGTWRGHMVAKIIYIAPFITKYYKGPCKSPTVQEEFHSELKYKYLWGKTWKYIIAHSKAMKQFLISCEK